MNRRTSLSLLLGKQQESAKKQTASNNSLDRYTGEWTIVQAAHLLRRTTFGPTYPQMQQAVVDGLTATIAQLFADQVMPEPPIYFNFEDDPAVPLGETWINTIENNEIDKLRSRRRQSMFAWTFKNMCESRISINIREKMTLFWHNHFVASNPNKSRRFYQYYNLLRENALGNFKTLTEKITVDAAMLRFLDGGRNTKNAPNENYARELLELFTIGKGPIAGPGDYTNYTEQDVVELARALTGWRFLNGPNLDGNISYFVQNRYDNTPKQLSPRFDAVIIQPTGENEYKRVIDIIFQKAEVARFIARKLYGWFLNATITEEVESSIIEPMAQLIIDNNYEIKPALITLLSSKHFYETTYRGCMITHPIDYFFKMVNTFQIALPTDKIELYKVFYNFYQRLKPLEMNIFYHPTVAGWKAFYQAPQFTKIWINSVSLPVRQALSDRFVKGYRVNGFLLKLNLLDFVISLDNPTDPNDLINGIATTLFAQPITAEQLIALKAIILPGLPDYEWTVEYGDYLAGDASLESAIQTKLAALISTMLKMPEFYLI